MRVERRRAGSTLPLLLVLLLLVGAGGWNYWRNLQVEAKEPRPYAGYSDRDLAALIDAYRNEVDRLEGRSAARPGGAARAAGPLLGERLAAYERVRRASARRRKMETELAGQEGILRRLEREQQIRRERGRGWRLHLHRLVTI